MSLFYKFKKAYAFAFISFLSFSCYADDTLEQIINTNQTTQQAALESQQKIDALNLETESLLEQYRFFTRQTQNLKVETKHLQEVLKTQAQEKLSLEKQLKDIEITKREITPLVLRMLDNLEQFIALDLPFLTEERQQRLTKLKSMMLRADVNIAEKFRRILEAYQIENEYGNTIEAYKTEVEINGEAIPVDFLRLGRVALFYQRLDGSETGVWNKKEKRWQSLDDNYRVAVKNGLKMARKETAPDLLTLPIMAAENAK